MSTKNTKTKLFSTDQVCEMTSMSYRTLHRWTALDVLHPTQPSQGSGSKMRWSAENVFYVAVLRDYNMVDPLILGLQKAHDILKQVGIPATGDACLVVPAFREAEGFVSTLSTSDATKRLRDAGPAVVIPLRDALELYRSLTTPQEVAV